MMYDNDYLAHHGIKGQKWGVRRYQNPDGSLTDAGRKHYSKGFAGRRKTKHENKLLRSTMAKLNAEKDKDDALQDWGNKGSRTIELDNKASDLQDKADKAKNKAYEYDKKIHSKGFSHKKANELWKKAGELQSKADKAYSEYSKAESDEDDAGTKFVQKDTRYKQLDNTHKALADKYIKKYGQQEYDSLPKDKHQITTRAIDDYLKAMNGGMSKSEFNRKYRNTGFAVHSGLTQDYLVHHGIKGQKWGIRRFQNPDRSLTDEGRRHYGFGKGSGLITKNTKQRAIQGAKLGAKLGVGLGIVSGGLGLASLAAAGMTNPVGLAGVGAAYLASGIAGGALDGLRYGAIIGSVETSIGRDYIKKNDKGLKDFEMRELNRKD